MREKCTVTALNLSKHKKTCQWASARPGNLCDFNNTIWLIKSRYRLKKEKKKSHPFPPRAFSECTNSVTGLASGTGPALIRSEMGTLQGEVQAGEQGLWQLAENNPPKILGEENPRKVLRRWQSAGRAERSGTGLEKPNFSSAECRLASAAANAGARGGRSGSGIFIALNFPLCYLARVRKCSRTGNTAAILSPG